MPRWFQNYSNRYNLSEWGLSYDMYAFYELLFRNVTMIYRYTSTRSMISESCKKFREWYSSSEKVPHRTNYRFRTEINYIEVDVYYTGFIVPLIYNLRERVAEGVRVARDVTSSRSFRLMPDEKISRESNFTRRGKRGKENQLGVGQSPAGQ